MINGLKLLLTDQRDEIVSTFKVIQQHNLYSANEQQLQENISSMTKIFDEIYEDGVKVEIVRFRGHLKAAKLKTEKVKSRSSLSLLSNGTLENPCQIYHCVWDSFQQFE